jgi:hypothetical protein
MEQRHPELAHHLDLALRAAVAPDHDEVGLQRHDAFQVDLAVGADLRDLLGVFREVAIGHDPDHMAAAAGREQQLGNVRRQRDHALGRLLQGDGVAVVVLHGDGCVGLDDRQGGEEDQCFRCVHRCSILEVRVRYGPSRARARAGQGGCRAPPGNRRTQIARRAMCS